MEGTDTTALALPDEFLVQLSIPPSSSAIGNVFFFAKAFLGAPKHFLTPLLRHFSNVWRIESQVYSYMFPFLDAALHFAKPHEHSYNTMITMTAKFQLVSTLYACLQQNNLNQHCPPAPIIP